LQFQTSGTYGGVVGGETEHQRTHEYPNRVHDVGRI
jgi:hypothetical protein